MNSELIKDYGFIKKSVIFAPVNLNQSNYV